jgi:hypothetical protein
MLIWLINIKKKVRKSPDCYIMIKAKRKIKMGSAIFRGLFDFFWGVYIFYFLVVYFD